MKQHGRLFSFKSLRLLVIVMGLIVTLFSTAQAVGAHSQSAAGPPGKQIDWAHPIKLQEVASQGVKSPFAGFPSGCYNNYAYYVKILGNTSWTAPTYYNAYRVTIHYMWCPRWSGDSVGKNWANGSIDIISPGCITIKTGQDSDGLFGAFVMDSPYDVAAKDGEGETLTTLCQGQTLVDDSLTVAGNGLWAMYMQVEAFLQGGSVATITANSPCCY